MDDQESGDGNHVAVARVNARLKWPRRTTALVTGADGRESMQPVEVLGPVVADKCHNRGYGASYCWLITARVIVDGEAASRPVDWMRLADVEAFVSGQISAREEIEERRTEKTDLVKHLLAMGEATVMELIARAAKMGATIHQSTIAVILMHMVKRGDVEKLPGVKIAKSKPRVVYRMVAR